MEKNLFQKIKEKIDKIIQINSTEDHKCMVYIGRASCESNSQNHIRKALYRREKSHHSADELVGRYFATKHITTDENQLTTTVQSAVEQLQLKLPEGVLVELRVHPLKVSPLTFVEDPQEGCQLEKDLINHYLSVSVNCSPGSDCSRAKKSQVIYARFYKVPKEWTKRCWEPQVLKPKAMAIVGGNPNKIYDLTCGFKLELVENSFYTEVFINETLTEVFLGTNVNVEHIKQIPTPGFVSIESYTLTTEYFPKQVHRIDVRKTESRDDISSILVIEIDGKYFREFFRIDFE